MCTFSIISSHFMGLDDTKRRNSASFATNPVKFVVRIKICLYRSSYICVTHKTAKRYVS